MISPIIEIFLDSCKKKEYVAQWSEIFSEVVVYLYTLYRQESFIAKKHKQECAALIWKFCVDCYLSDAAVFFSDQCLLLPNSVCRVIDNLLDLSPQFFTRCIHTINFYTLFYEHIKVHIF